MTWRIEARSKREGSRWETFRVVQSTRKACQLLKDLHDTNPFVFARKMPVNSTFKTL